MSKSPLAPSQFPMLPMINGVTFSAVGAGIKYKDRKDVMLARLCEGSTVAGVFTKSLTRAAPVLDCQSKIGGAHNGAAAFIVNSGNANAFTGRNGAASVKAITNMAATVLDIDEARIFTASTGVIGEPLPHDRITAKLEELRDTLSGGKIQSAAEAIMTTDTFPKGAGAQVETDDGTVKIMGFAKGSGMIAPDMATMLVYIFTDAKIAQDDLQAMVSELNEDSFNCITVDSDTSTSDSLLMGATGQSDVSIPRDHVEFRAALSDVMLDLAHQVVKDGEGATKFVAINVTGAATKTEAKQIGLSIANSPLVKTAIAGEDPNWGRIVMAVGKSGAQADRDALTIKFGDITVAQNGWVSPDYREEDGATYMKNAHLSVSVDVGVGAADSTVWTCDLTHGYITINADYRS
jgi:glutamate N-acetyltransferase/amino-acid N-acetyltransferase